MTVDKRIIDNLKRQDMKEINEMSADERKAALKELLKADKEDKLNARDAYEGLRAQFMHEVFAKLEPMTEDVTAFKKWLDEETQSFKELMRSYGQLKSDGQASMTVTDGDMRLKVKQNKVKAFDERADMAAERLVNYLKAYAAQSDKGSDEPMYQLAMTLLERNKQGDLDYKSISKLYEMEGKFDEEYSEIMNLFRESNLVTQTVVNYYFEKKDKDGVWRRIEPSFCRL